uniref:uncharacterized protein LOC120348458 n=1 Tax=Styela clava TaxID=7725 RepID=UPI00193AAA86|nr:uncharacterized protein LOC120348458 [Styela clava]
MKIFLIACLCYMFVATGYAIQCYYCFDCIDAGKLVSSQLINCSISQVSCEWSSSKGIVTRTCGGNSSAITGCKTMTDGKSTGTVCLCKGDGCNGADITPTTTAAATHSSAGSIKSSIILVSVISLLVAKFIIV